MKISDKRIDKGKAFDWGKTSEDYAKYRDIYPEIFYQTMVQRGIGVKGQKILDLGTGTGVLPRNMYRFGADWTGIDISPEQIEQAKLLSEGNNMDNRFLCVSAEEAEFENESFDVITACQCFWYFDYKKVIPKLYNFLKPGGKLVLLCMEWLPFEDKVAGESETLVLKYSPDWSGAGETMKPIEIPREMSGYFELKEHEEYKLYVPFTRESWNGRMKACRGVGASLNEKELKCWEKEHKALLERIAPEKFDVLHFAAIAVLEKK